MPYHAKAPITENCVAIFRQRSGAHPKLTVRNLKTFNLIFAPFISRFRGVHWHILKLLKTNTETEWKVFLEVSTGL